MIINFFVFLSLPYANSDLIIIPATGGSTRTVPNINRDFISLEDFNRSVLGGDSDLIRGVYVEDVMALRVLQQPDGDHEFVSTIDGTTTQFQMAKKNGTTGFLAHNYSSGRFFTDLREGQLVQVIYGKGAIKSYKINHILRFQALQPESPMSDFIDLQTKKFLTTAQLFSQVYTSDQRVVFQTCIQQGDEYAWGRLFVMADPV